MSTFNNGSGQIQSTNLPAALLELAEVLSLQEALLSTIDAPLTNITVTLDLEANSAGITASLPIAATINTSGNIVLAATNYIASSTYVVGSGGDIRATSVPGAFLEIAQLVSAAELAVAVNPPNNVTIAFDLEGQLATVTAALPISAAIDASGKILTTATDYLP